MLRLVALRQPWKLIQQAVSAPAGCREGVSKVQTRCITLSQSSLKKNKDKDDDINNNNTQKNIDTDMAWLLGSLSQMENVEPPSSVLSEPRDGTIKKDENTLLANASPDDSLHDNMDFLKDDMDFLKMSIENETFVSQTVATRKARMEGKKSRRKTTTTETEVEAESDSPSPNNNENKVQENDPHVLEVTSFIESEVNAPPAPGGVGTQTTSRITTLARRDEKKRLKQLREQIRGNRDFRDVSNLMEFLSSEEELSVDGAHSSMQTTQQLMDEMLVHSQQWNEKKFRDIFSMPPSHRFFPNYEAMEAEPDDRVKSLHEQNATEDLHFGGGGSGRVEPQNGFEVQMLNVDTHWQFPINNQVDMAEDRYTFEDHVFLDHHLDDFSDSEPVHKYMELVVTGLQQNPYLSYEEKIGKIQWYKEYFSKFDEESLR